MDYAELICQSNFSFLHAASHPEELVQQACFYGYSAIAITDECSVAGVVRAYSHIKKNNLKIKLIIGAKFVFSKQVELTLLCPNRRAYAELCRIISNSRRRAEKGNYQLALWDLKSLRHCFVIWTPSYQQDNNEHTAQWLLNLSTHYKSHLWIGARRHLLASEQNYLEHLEYLAHRYNLPITACGDAKMHSQKRLPLLHTLHAIKLGCRVAQLGQQTVSNAECALQPINKIKKLFKAQWLNETLNIANRCDVFLHQLQYEYPAELIPKNQKPIDYLRELVAIGVKKRFPTGVDESILTTIEKELALIEEMEYEHFFITIYDIVQFAQSQKILYQGRGSAANSIVCYCLEITSVDPKQISVLFERFISKERQEPPDIDVDFEHHRREEIFQYIYKKYGRKHTAITATVITYRLKSAIKDVGKTLGLPLTQLEFFVKNINRRHAEVPWYQQLSTLGLDPTSRLGTLFIQLVEEIKGFPRHLSQHVGGFIISSGPLYELVPVENAAMPNRTVIQWDKDDLETLKLLKVDVLALGMLSAIRRSFDLIKAHYQRTLSIADITAKGDDNNVYQMIQQADTVGVFQIESRAQMSMLPRLKPRCYYDLVIQIAIVRPGPIQGGMVHPYLQRRDGIEPVNYPSEPVKDVLERTLGVPIFQEQVIKLAMVAAGFSGGEADQLRRAMGKWKKNGELLTFKQKLTEGMSARGYDDAYIERIFQQICGFGEYGFPESHSASFAVLAYVSAWLKFYYPEVFYCALLNSYPMGFYSPSQLLQDAKRHKVNIAPCCINHSDWHHTLEFEHGEATLRLGFRIIKGLGEKTAQLLITQRPKTGFSNITQLKKLNINKTELQALASANSLTVISGNRFESRWQLMNSENDLPLFADLHNQIDTFQIKPSRFDDLTEDYAALGLSLELHPIQLLTEHGLLGRYVKASDLLHQENNTMVTVVGVVTGRQSPGTAAGVTFMTLEDDTGNINVIVWKATALAQRQNFLTARILKVKGVLERKDQVVHIVAGQLIDETDLLENLVSQSRDFH